VLHLQRKRQEYLQRYSNPNNNEFISKVCAMEGAAAGFAFASGMAAVYSTMAALLNSEITLFLRAVFLVQRTRCLLIIFQNGTYKPRIFDINQPETIEGLITPENSFAESPTNPAVDIIDLELLEILPKAQFNFNY
jgi:O-succinylhomoserine sulfhydrylase